MVALKTASGADSTQGATGTDDTPTSRDAHASGAGEVLAAAI